MNLDRLGGSTFDFMVKTNKKKHYDVTPRIQRYSSFTMVAREERGGLEEWVIGKGLRSSYSKEVIRENRKKRTCERQD